MEGLKTKRLDKQRMHFLIRETHATIGNATRLFEHTGKSKDEDR